MSIDVQRRQFTIDDFARMGEAGILAEDERVELINGEVRRMSPINPPHASIVSRLNAILTNRLGDRVIITVQSPVILNDFSEPQPDLLVLRRRKDFYSEAHPRPKDVLVLIEVADTTLEYDRDEKIPRYNEARIPEVWLVDVQEKNVTQFARPGKNGYRIIEVFTRGMELTSVSIKSLQLGIGELFPRS